MHLSSETWVCILQRSQIHHNHDCIRVYTLVRFHRSFIMNYFVTEWIKVTCYIDLFLDSSFLYPILSLILKTNILIISLNMTILLYSIYNTNKQYGILFWIFKCGFCYISICLINSQNYIRMSLANTHKLNLFQYGSMYSSVSFNDQIQR